MGDRPEHDDDFAVSAMKAMFDTADVSIQRDGGTQVVSNNSDLPPLKHAEAGQRETAGSFAVGEPKLASTDLDGRDAGSSATALTVAALVFAIALACAIYTLM